MIVFLVGLAILSEMLLWDDQLIFTFLNTLVALIEVRTFASLISVVVSLQLLFLYIVGATPKISRLH